MSPKCKSTPSRNPLHFGASSSADTTPFFVRFHDEKARSDFFWELFLTRHSFGTPRRLVELLRHWPSHCHLQSGSGVTVWRLGHMFIRADLGVLLQHALIRLFSTSFHYSCSRYRIVVIPEIVSDMLRVPRVEHPDYPGCDRLKTVSKDELISSSCERSSD